MIRVIGFILTPFLFFMLLIIPFWSFKHEGILAKKVFINSCYKMSRYKQSDITITYDEYLSLKSIKTDLAYISEPEYIFYVDGNVIYVSQSIYNSYNEGDNITYYKKYLYPYINIKE